MLRAKKEAEFKPGNDPDSRLGLGSFGMKASVMEHFRRISDPDTDYRLALQSEAAMGRLARMAAVEKAE